MPTKYTNIDIHNVRFTANFSLSRRQSSVTHNGCIHTPIHTGTPCLFLSASHKWLCAIGEVSCQIAAENSSQPHYDYQKKHGKMIKCTLPRYVYQFCRIWKLNNIAHTLKFTCPWFSYNYQMKHDISVDLRFPELIKSVSIDHNFHNLSLTRINRKE